MFCSQMFLLFPLAMLLPMAFSFERGCNVDPLNCNPKSLLFTNETKKYQWPACCEIFHGELQLRHIDMRTADFSKLRKISGSLSLVHSKLHRMPRMSSLVEIETNGVRPGVIILNNRHLQDMRGFVNWDKDVKITGDSEFPVFISGNRELDTINLPRQFHKPLSPLLCEKRLAPFYNIQFAEGCSLAVTLMVLIFSATIFMYPMSMGSSNVYFVPGYHRNEIY